MANLPLRWTSHLKSKDSREQFEGSLRASSTAMLRLRQILMEDEEALNKQAYSTSDFEEPNWAYKQAFRNGALSQIKHLQDLLSYIDRN